MKRSTDFRPSERTILTESRMFVVDKHTRSPLNRANQSVLIDQGTMKVEDVNVTDTNHHTVNVTKCLTITCPSPVILSFTSNGPITQPDVPPSSGYEDATILTNDFIIGNDLVITVVDDTPLPLVTVVLLNAVTGETESLTLTRQGEVFVGKIPTSLIGVWTSFDGIMHPEHDQPITIMYADTRSSSGKTKQIKTTVKAISPYTDADIMVPAVLNLGRPIGVVVQDRDLDSSIGSVFLEYEIEGNVNTIELQRAERAYGSVFVGTIDTTSLYMELNDTVTFRYNDPRDANGFPKVIEKQAIVLPATHSTGELNIPDAFAGFGSHLIRLRDMDIIGHSVQLIALNERTQRYLPVVCDETVYASGEFVGQLVLSPDQVPESLQAATGDSIKITYVDQNSQDGTSRLVEAVAPFTVPDAPPPPVEPPVFVPGTVDMQVDGLFTLYGNFVGTITVKGISEVPVRCNIVVA